MNYNQFIENKILTVPKEGFVLDRTWLHESNKPHQADTIEWCALGARRAVFASFGLGKTQIQLEQARITIKAFGGSALIICPLGVKQEFMKDAKRLGIELTYVKNQQDVEESKTAIIFDTIEKEAIA